MTTIEEEKFDAVLFRYIKDSALYLAENPYSVVHTKALKNFDLVPFCTSLRR